MILNYSRVANTCRYTITWSLLNSIRSFENDVLINNYILMALPTSFLALRPRSHSLCCTEKNPSCDDPGRGGGDHLQGDLPWFDGALTSSLHIYLLNNVLTCSSQVQSFTMSSLLEILEVGSPIFSLSIILVDFKSNP